jgi:hypothetical protein
MGGGPAAGDETDTAGGPALRSIRTPTSPALGGSGRPRSMVGSTGSPGSSGRLSRVNVPDPIGPPQLSPELQVNEEHGVLSTSPVSPGACSWPT